MAFNGVKYHIKPIIVSFIDKLDFDVSYSYKAKDIYFFSIF